MDHDQLNEITEVAEAMQKQSAPTSQAGPGQVIAPDGTVVTLTE